MVWIFLRYKHSIYKCHLRFWNFKQETLPWFDKPPKKKSARNGDQINLVDADSSCSSFFWFVCEMLFNICGSWQEWNYSKVWKGGRFPWPGSCWAQLYHLHLPDLWSCWREMWENAGISSSRGLWPSTAPLLFLLRNKYLRQWDNGLSLRQRLFRLSSWRNRKFNEYPLSVQSIWLSTTKAICKSRHDFPIHTYSSKKITLQKYWALS